MKKRLLLSLMAGCMAVTGFALTTGEYVYTPQGRFQIVGENLNPNSAFADFSGWEVVTATEGKTIDDNFNVLTDGYAAGINSVQSLAATAGEGMYFKFEPSNSNTTYVVSFKMKGSNTASIRIKTDILQTNLALVQGNTDGVYGGATDVLTVNKAEGLNGEWQQFNYAIVGDGTARTYFISFTGMATDIEIADVQIAQAIQFADLRLRDAMIEKMEAYKNVYNWSQDVLEKDGFDENLEALKEIGDETSVAELTEQLEACNEVLTDFLNDNMDDYLAGDRKNHFNYWPGKTQKASTWGEWTVFPGGRGFWESESQGCPDLGHYAGSNTWGTTVHGVSMQKELSAGSYVFTIEGRAAFRENGSSNTWTNNDGLKVAVATAYIMKVPAEGVEPTAADTLKAVAQLLDPLEFTTAIVAVQIPEDGTYEIGYKAIPREELQGTKQGSVLYVHDAYLYGKNSNKYNQKQLAYEEAVRTQITTGRNNLTTAAENLADASKFWGKADLKAVADEIEPKIAAYEAMDQDAIIATYDGDIYVNSVNDENGLLQYEVYQTATKYIIAANRTFNAVNDTLNSMQTVIDNAEATLAQRIYDAATGKEALRTAIETAKGVQTEMKATDYSIDNAAAIVAANDALNEAIELFKTTIPKDAIVEIVSLDFENGATLNAETNLYQVAGTNTVMEFSYFKETTPSEATDLPFELGIDANGEKVLKGVLRVGNGTGTSTIPEREYGTNIVKVSMDWWFVRLTDRFVGFDLLGEEDKRVAGLYFSPYWWYSTGQYDDFALTPDGTGYNVNFFVGNTTGDAGSCTDDNKSHVEVILDYGEKSMYLVSTTTKGSYTSDKVAFSGDIPTKFVVKSNYTNYNGRRCWFDNLKIEQITAGPTDQFEGIQEIQNAEQRIAAPTKVLKNGRIIINGRYTVGGTLVK